MTERSQIQQAESQTHLLPPPHPPLTPLGFIIFVKNISVYPNASSLFQTVLQEKFWPFYFFLISTSNSSKFIDFSLLHISPNHLLCPSLNMNNCRNLTIWACYSLLAPLALDPFLAIICHGLTFPMPSLWVFLGMCWPESGFYQTLINYHVICPFRLRGTNGLLFAFVSGFFSFHCKWFFFHIFFRQSLLSELPLFLQNTEWPTISSHSLCPLENLSISHVECLFNWKFTSIMFVIKTLQRLLCLLRTERNNSNLARSIDALGPACFPVVLPLTHWAPALLLFFISLNSPLGVWLWVSSWILSSLHNFFSLFLPLPSLTSNFTLNVSFSGEAILETLFHFCHMDLILQLICYRTCLGHRFIYLPPNTYYGI